MGIMSICRKSKRKGAERWVSFVSLKQKKDCREQLRITGGFIRTFSSPRGMQKEVFAAMVRIVQSY